MRLDTRFTISIIITSSIFLILTCLIAGLFLMNINNANLSDALKINAGELGVAFGTILLGFFTAILVFTEINDSTTNRRLQRISQKLVEFYSPLLSYVKILDDENEHSYHQEHRLGSLMDDLRFSYEFLANNELRDRLRFYYDYLNGIQTTLTPEQSQNRRQEWLRTLVEIRRLVDHDYNELVDEYNRLT